MADPATYAIIENGVTTFYYYRSGALSIVRDLFYGPEHAIKRIKLVAKEGVPLVGDAEGAIVLDLDRKRATFFQVYGPLCSEARRVLVLLMQTSWPGWELRWAEEYIYEIAEILGIDFPSLKLCQSTNIHSDYRLKPPRLVNPPPYYECLLTIRGKDGIRDLGFEDSLTSILSTGPEILNRIEHWPPADLADQEKQEIMEAGAYIDLLERHIAWQMRNGCDIETCRYFIQSKWPGWSMEFHHEGLPGQWKRSGRDPAAVSVGEAAILRQIVALLTDDWNIDPETIFDISRKIAIEPEHGEGEVSKGEHAMPDIDTRLFEIARSIASYRRTFIRSSTETAA